MFIEGNKTKVIEKEVIVLYIIYGKEEMQYGIVLQYKLYTLKCCNIF